MSALVQKRPNFAAQRNDAMCHVWTAPGWQELSSRLQHWSVQPYVRPLSAAHVAAGHNALRGSGPGQKHAFDDALAQVGCPDRRIDRLCITYCLPFPTFTSRRVFDAISFTPQARRVWSGFVGGLAAGAVIGGGYYGGGYYGGPYAYDGGCYIQRQAFINRFGHRVIRRVRVCD